MLYNCAISQKLIWLCLQFPNETNPTNFTVIFANFWTPFEFPEYVNFCIFAIIGSYICKLLSYVSAQHILCNCWTARESHFHYQVGTS